MSVSRQSGKRLKPKGNIMIELDKIYNQDCLEGMRQIPDGSIDAVICDLPYGTTDNTWDALIPFDKLWEQYRRIAKPKAPIILFGAEPFSTTIRMSNFDWYKYDWIWQKNIAVGFLRANERPLRAFENICVFYKERPTYNPQGVRKCHKVQRRGRVGDNYAMGTSNEYVTEYENYPKDILTFDKDTDGFHPTQKPVDLLRYLVLTYTNEGDTVLDNCMGSGTTAIACIKERRHFIGFELSKEYFDKAQRRIKAEQAQLTLF